jgi:RNA chaperone Hfq
MVNDSIRTKRLDEWVDGKVPVTVFLLNGVKLLGIIEEYDDTCMWFFQERYGGQVVHFHAVSTVMLGSVEGQRK